MELDPELCYTALTSRDPRFDGRFFTAVLTTGVYCRPICPAITPRRENVTFYPSAAAAQQAGFRPCLRCRPEASPGSPDWQASSALVTRSLRLISEGVLDENGVDGLAERMHIGARQLRRLFVQHLGAPPIAVAQIRRVHFARRLIDETQLSMSEIAFSAGFSSLRRFNAAVRQTYGRSPTELRRKRQPYPGHNGKDALHLKLFYRPPYDWPALIGFLRSRAIPGVEAVEDACYRRTVRIGEASGIIEVQPVLEEHHLLLTVPAQFSRHMLLISERVRDQFDLRTDLLAVASRLGEDEKMGELVKAHPGLRVPGAWDGFELSVRAILGQQISVKAASTMAGRLVEAFGERLPQAEELNPGRLFPTPHLLAEAELTEIGLTRPRALCIRELARAVRDGELSFSTSAGLDETVERLTALPGIGNWTAHYIALRALREPDAFPAGDLALRRVASQNSLPLSETELLKQAEAWRPWRAYAAMHLWNSYSAGQAKK
jgi:AraC family transcriptional regulator, regulatory protein of adaptative response / DNA-3-methyladenine glycosylase II